MSSKCMLQFIVHGTYYPNPPEHIKDSLHDLIGLVFADAMFPHITGNR